jgi:hypothetical protein
MPSKRQRKIKIKKNGGLYIVLPPQKNKATAKRTDNHNNGIM